MDSLSVSDEADIKADRAAKAAAAAAATSALFGPSTTTTATEVDMSTLDLEAYMAANAAGDSGGGGGLFD